MKLVIWDTVYMVPGLVLFAIKGRLISKCPFGVFK